jgi:predicted acyl esterase
MERAGRPPRGRRPHSRTDPAGDPRPAAAAGDEHPPAPGCRQAVTGGRATWYRDWGPHDDTSDPWWGARQLGAALHRVRVPVLLIGGWQDLFLDQTLEQHVILRRRGVPVGLTVGPWTHTEVLTRGARVMTRETLDWLREHPEGKSSRARAPPGDSHRSTRSLAPRHGGMTGLPAREPWCMPRGSAGRQRASDAAAAVMLSAVPAAARPFKHSRYRQPRAVSLASVPPR